MKSHQLKITVTKNRKGAVVAIAARPDQKRAFEEFTLSVGGVLNHDDLREAVLQLLGAAVDPCVEALKSEVDHEAERIAALRVKERDATRSHRAKKAQFAAQEGAAL